MDIQVQREIERARERLADGQSLRDADKQFERRADTKRGEGGVERELGSQIDRESLRDKIDRA